MRLLAIVTGLFLAIGLAACGSEEEESSTPSGTSLQTVQIGETEFKLQPSSVTVDKPGIYTFHAVNNGTTDHALEIEGEGLETETENIAPGDSADLKVELKKGSYEMYCPVADHKDRGMKGSIAVGGAMAGATTGDDDSGDDTGGYGGG